MQSEHSAQYLDEATPATSGGRSLSAMDPKKKVISTSSAGQRTSAGLQSIDQRNLDNCKFKIGNQRLKAVNSDFKTDEESQFGLDLTPATQKTQTNVALKKQINT